MYFLFPPRTVDFQCFLSFEPFTKRSTCWELQEISVCPKAIAKQGECAEQWREATGDSAGTVRSDTGRERRGPEGRETPQPQEQLRELPAQDS